MSDEVKQVAMEDVEKPETPEVEKPEKKEEPKYVTVEDLQKLQKQFNGVSQTLRHIKDIPGQIAELRQSIQQNRTLSPVKKQEAQDELDELLEKGDWRTPVKKVAEMRFEELMAERDEKFRLSQAQNMKLSTLEENKKVVRDRYQDIDDPESEIAKRYQKVLSEKPHYLGSEFGPVLAMRDMEDELRSEGRLDEFTKKAVEKEVTRQTRAGAGGVPKAAISGSNKVVLSKEQKDFCDSNGIKYENYLKFVRVNAKEGAQA